MRLNIKKLLIIIFFVGIFISALYYYDYTLFIKTIFVALLGFLVFGYFYILKLNNKYIYLILGIILVVLFQTYGLILFLILMILPIFWYLSKKHKKYKDYLNINEEL